MSTDDVVEQLPRGRHGLTREEVETSQRERLLLAMCEAVAERGYIATSVADVIARARVSRETFYRYFADKQACFHAAHDHGVEILLAEMGEALAPAAELEPLERLDRATARYLDVLAAHPAIARTFLVEVYAAGPEALRRRVEVQDAFVDVIAAMLEADGEHERFACRMYVGAASALITNHVSVGRFDELPALREPLLAVVRDALSLRDVR
jgi:AcrR family transcriptional regulator